MIAVSFLVGAFCSARAGFIGLKVATKANVGTTNAAIRKMVLPGLLAGITVTGVLMAIFKSNAEGAWSNAKKMFEEEIELNGTHYAKGSEPQQAAVVGDSVGDPFKNTSGLSLNYFNKVNGCNCTCYCANN